MSTHSDQPASFENVHLRSLGRIAGALSFFLGTLSLLAVLCFHFPQYLTTEKLAQTYNLVFLRSLLQAAMVLSLVSGAVAFFRWKAKRFAFAGICTTLAAQWLGGASVEVADFEWPVVSFGVDWLILALLANTLVFVFIERLFPHRDEQLTLRRGWRLDLAYYAFNHIMVSVVLLVTTYFSEDLFGWAVNDGFRNLVRGQPLVIQFLEVMFVADLVQYALHRTMHENKFLWRFHAVHHCPAEMDWLSGSRIHFFEVLTTRSAIITPIYLLGFSEGAVNGYVVWVGIQAVLIHANTSIPFGPLRHLFVTPHFHHWHHAADAEAIDRNYAAHLSFLDRIFGTYIDNHDRWPTTYGVVGKPLPNGFWLQHLYPFMPREPADEPSLSEPPK